MRVLSLCLVLFHLFILSPLFSQQVGMADRVKQVADSFSSEVTEFRRQYAEARANGTTAPVAPDGTEAVEKVLQMIALDPEDPAVIDAAAFIFEWGRYAKSRPDVSMAYDYLLQHHLDNEAIGIACVRAMYAPFSQSSELILKVRNNEANPKAAGAAAWVLGKRARNDDEKIEQLEFAVENLGDFSYGNRPLIDTVSKYLEVTRKFSVGQSAPDIEGSDTEGINFKLSDYLGKVVVLDFWGHW